MRRGRSTTRQLDKTTKNADKNEGRESKQSGNFSIKTNFEVVVVGNVLMKNITASVVMSKKREQQGGGGAAAVREQCIR